MPQVIRDEVPVLVRFGGGRNSRASEDSIHDLECTDGENFLLDPGNSEFRPREPIDLVGTVPNGNQIDGFVTLKKLDGTVSMLVQAGTAVYEFDGISFTSVGTVAAGSKLRGTIEAFWALGDKVLVSDLGLAEEIHSWDGTSFTQESFLQEDGSTAFSGDLRCKYIVVEDERAFYGNIHDNGSLFPHLLVSSERGNFLIVSNATRGSDAASAEDAWFLPTPQLRTINGMGVSFGVLAISQEFGAFEKLSGSNATDYNLQKLHRGSGATGDEAVITTGNDIVFGAQGRIESLNSTDKFGDVEQDDVSFKISDDIESFNNWTLVYNRRLKRIYCFPANQNEVHVAFTEFIGSELSPWSKYTTRHPFSFSVTAAMNCYNPVDGLEYVYMGDGSGNVYRMEGTAGSGDAGSTVIDTFRRSKLSESALDAESFNAHGWLQYRKKGFDTTDSASLKFLFAGEDVYDKEIEVVMPPVTFSPLYGGSFYYGDNIYYGATNENRLVRSIFGLAHFANQWQVESRVESKNNFEISEIGIRSDIAG